MARDGQALPNICRAKRNTYAVISKGHECSPFFLARNAHTHRHNLHCLLGEKVAVTGQGWAGCEFHLKTQPRHLNAPSYRACRYIVQSTISPTHPLTRILKLTGYGWNTHRKCVTLPFRLRSRSADNDCGLLASSNALFDPWLVPTAQPRSPSTTGYLHRGLRSHTPSTEIFTTLGRPRPTCMADAS